MTPIRRSRGFSLIELALGLVIVATMLSALLVPLATQIDQRRTAETQRLLEEARDALVGFAVANGRFPCPAVDAASGTEAFRKAPQAAPAGDALNGLCFQYRGWLPAADLGLSPLDRAGYLLDGYGGDANRVRYAVADVQGTGANDRVYTARDGIKNFLGTDPIRTLSANTNRLTICNGATAADTTACPTSAGDVTLANGNAIAVVWSVGKEPAGRGVGEQKNLVITVADDVTIPTNTIMVSRTQSDLAGSEFDDLLLWISPNLLITRMVTAQRLP